jgi:hypothetical protein
VKRQSCEQLSISILINCTEVRYPISIAIIGKYHVYQRNEKVLAILRMAACKVSAEGIEDCQVTFGCIEKRLGENYDEESQKIDSVLVEGGIKMVGRLWDADSRLPDQVLIDSYQKVY